MCPSASPAPLNLNQNSAPLCCSMRKGLSIINEPSLPTLLARTVIHKEIKTERRQASLVANVRFYTDVNTQNQMELVSTRSLQFCTAEFSFSMRKFLWKSISSHIPCPALKLLLFSAVLMNVFGKGVWNCRENNNFPTKFFPTAM